MEAFNGPPAGLRALQAEQGDQDRRAREWPRRVKEWCDAIQGGTPRHGTHRIRGGCANPVVLFIEERGDRLDIRYVPRATQIADGQDTYLRGPMGEQRSDVRVPGAA